MPEFFEVETTADKVAKALQDNICGKSVLITGTSPQGLGSYTALAIARQDPSVVTIATRSKQSLEETSAWIKENVPSANIRLLELDLSSQAQVREAAKEVNAYPEKLDVLINNAGIMATSQGKTVDGIEKQLGVNHIGHFLFTNLIMDKITSPGGRIVNLSSTGYTVGAPDWNDINMEKNGYNKWVAYARSKTANILFSASLAKKLKNKGILSFSVHPGSTKTRLSRDLVQEDWDFFATISMKYKTLSQGAATSVAAAFASSAERYNGCFWSDGHPEDIRPECPWASGDENAETVWKVSEKLVGHTFNY